MVIIHIIFEASEDIFNQNHFYHSYPLTMSTVFEGVTEVVKRTTCDNGNDFNGMMGARISSVFVILVGSTFGAVFPILSSRYSFVRMPSWCFFLAKYFGSGVIVATAFIHLLQPANEALSDECLGEAWQVYPYAFAICLVTLFLLFFSELMAFRFIDKKLDSLAEGGHSHSHFGESSTYVKQDEAKGDSDEDQEMDHISTKSEHVAKSYPNHFSHAAEHQDLEAIGTLANDEQKEQYYGQLLAVFVLEFGVVFHSIFVGLTLAVAGDEFKTLYVVIVFHQLFEGLGLGTRIALATWPKNRSYIPWLLALAYGVCTPISIAIGLGVRQSYPPNSATSLITSGIFDSVSAGILIYTGLVELMAHEFLYSNEFKSEDGTRRIIFAYLCMCTGAGLMALLGRWA